MAINLIKKSQRLNNTGFTITEVLVGTALLTMIVIGGLTAFDQLNKISTDNQTVSTVDDRVIEIIENIRQQPTTQILQFDDASDILSSSTLKMAWSNQVDLPESECSECPGRYGYVITPASQATTDLYLVTIWFTHTEWGKEIKKYEFLVSQ